MTTTIQENGNQLIAQFSGRLDTAAAVQTAEDVKPMMEAQNKELILDCTNLDFGFAYLPRYPQRSRYARIESDCAQHQCRHPSGIYDDRIHVLIRYRINR